MSMSLYERIDRDASLKSGETFEHHLIYAVCFAAVLLPATIRWLGRRRGEGKGRSILGEARTMASNCATTSFMGM
jgi:hypothetical protein